MNMVIQWNTIQSQNSISGSHHCGTEGKAATGMPSFHRGSSFSPSSFTSNPAPCLTCLDGPNLWAPAPMRAETQKKTLAPGSGLLQSFGKWTNRIKRCLGLSLCVKFRLFKYINILLKQKQTPHSGYSALGMTTKTIRWQSQLTD